MAQVTAQDIEKLIMEVPEGYEPQPFTPAQVRGIQDIRADFESDHEDWLSDLRANLKEQYMPAEELYQQEENLRMIEYRKENAGDDQELIDLLQAEEDRLIDRYVKQRTEAEEQMETAYAAEVKRHYIADLNILNGKYKPAEDQDLVELSLSEEELLKGYEPAPFKGSGVTRSIEEQRELFEMEEEGSDEMVPVDEKQWAADMQKIISEEVMPASLLHGQEEMLRKIQYQIDKLNMDGNVRIMDEPYELVEPDKDILGDELYEDALRDQQYKADLNRRIEIRNGLQQEFDNLLDMISEERAQWEDEVERRMDEEIALRQEKLKDREEWLQQQKEEEELAAEQARKDAERQKVLEEEAKLFAKEARRREREEYERAIEEEKRKAEEAEAERRRRIEEYKKNAKAEQDVRDQKYILQHAARIAEERRRAKEEADYQAWLEERQNSKKRALKEQVTGVVEPGEGGDLTRANERPEAQGTGTGLDEFMNDDAPQQNLGGGDIDLGNQDSMDGLFETKPVMEEIDLGRQTGTAADFFEARPGEAGAQKQTGEEIIEPLQSSSEILSVKQVSDSITRVEKPVSKAVTLQKLKSSADVKENFGPIDQADKEEFFKEIGDWRFQHRGDKELLGDLFDARRGADNKVDYSIKFELEHIKETELKDLNDLNTREEALNNIKNKLQHIPEAERTEAQKKAIETVDKSIADVAALKEADQFAEEVYAKGWMAGESVFKDMYLAGRELDKNHPYNKQLENFRQGKNTIHPEFPLVKKGNGVIASLQTYDEFEQAKKLLDETGIDSPAARKAKESITKRQSEIKSRATGEREKLQGKYSKWVALSDEEREKCRQLEHKLSFDKKTRGMKNFLTISHSLSNAAHEPKKTKSWLDADLGSAAMDKLENLLPTLIKDMKADHKLYNDVVEVFSFVAPAEKVKEVTDAAKAELAERERQQFEAEMSKFKTIQQNLRAVEKSYFGHTNTGFYNNMKDALDYLINNANNMDELKAEKKKLADQTRAYLDHTGLGKASMFHPKAETRRKIAFLMFAETSTGEEPVEKSFETYKRRANALRNRSNQIDVKTLWQMPGVGTLAQANEAVREMDANALADKLGQNQPARESHQRKPAVTVNVPAADLKDPMMSDPRLKK